MDKKAATSVPIHDLIANRWSPRAFSDEAVSAENLTAIFEAARWAASAFNNQPWTFIVADKDNADAHQKMVDCLMPGNQPWAVNAPVLAFVVAKTIIDAAGDKPARPSGTARYDCGLAVGQLTIQAAQEDCTCTKWPASIAIKSSKHSTFPPTITLSADSLSAMLAHSIHSPTTACANASKLPAFASHSAKLW